MEKQAFLQLLEELDEELVRAFPDAPPLKAMVVGGACLLFSDILDRPTRDIDVVIWDLMGSEEEFTLFYKTPLATQICDIIRSVGKRHGLKGEAEQLFFNDACASFLLELGNNELPEMRIFKAYQKLHLFIPVDLSYILACKLMAGRPAKDHGDIRVLCQQLGIETRLQAQRVVDRFFPGLYQQAIHQLPKTLDDIFGKAGDV